MSDLTQFDRYLKDDGPAALVIREHLTSVEGKDGILFPATFAAGDGFAGGYNIDGDPAGDNICLIDTVGSQANRIEPMFAGGGVQNTRTPDRRRGRREAGQPARCGPPRRRRHRSLLGAATDTARRLQVRAERRRSAACEDCPDFPRLRSLGLAGHPGQATSTHRVYDPRVRRPQASPGRPSTYPPRSTFRTSFSKNRPTRQRGTPTPSAGFIHVPATGSHGGVLAHGGVRRDATLGLAALRLLHAGGDKEKTLALRRYILGLALTAFTRNPTGYLRQGCLLVLDPEKPCQFVEVLATGERKPASVTHEQALSYAGAVATAFGVGESRTVKFDGERAKKDVTGEGETKVKGKKGKRSDTGGAK